MKAVPFSTSCSYGFEPAHNGGACRCLTSSATVLGEFAEHVNDGLAVSRSASIGEKVESRTSTCTRMLRTRSSWLLRGERTITTLRSSSKSSSRWSWWWTSRRTWWAWRTSGRRLSRETVVRGNLGRNSLSVLTCAFWKWAVFHALG